MAKIFETQFHKGSYIDRISKAAGTNSNGAFRRTEKGIAWKGITTSVIEMNQLLILGTIFSFETWIRITDNSQPYQAIAGHDDNSYPCLVLPNIKFIYSHDGSNSVSENRPELFDHNWHHVLVTRNGTSVYFYIDNIAGDEKTLGSNNSISIDQLFMRSDTFAFREYCAQIIIYDNILTTNERNQAYKDFLNAKPLIEEKHPHYGPWNKPTDLSRLQDQGLQDVEIEIPRASPGSEYWVRPAGSTYGLGDGSDYDNAFAGFGDIDQLQPGDILYIRGTHNEALECNDSKINVGTITNYITLDFGDDDTFDYGIIDLQNLANSGIWGTARYYIGFNYARTINTLVDGIRIYGASYGIIFRYGDFSYSGNQGTQLLDTSKAIFYRCKSHHNVDDGFSQHDSTDGKYYYCEAYNNDHGFNIIETTTALTHGCIFYDNTTYDIYLTTSSVLDDYYSNWEKSPQITGSAVMNNEKYGLIEAYNMIHSNGVLVDISGNGNNHTINKGVSCLNGMQFDASKGDGTTVTRVVTGTVYTLVMRIKLLHAIDQAVISDSGSSDYLRLSNGTDTIVHRAGSGTAAVFSSAFMGTNNWFNLVLSRNDSVITAYLDGVFISSQTIDGTFNGYTGFANYPEFPFKGKIEDFQIYNYGFTEQQAIDYNNFYASRPVLQDSYLFDPVGVAVPREWIKGTGVYEIKEFAAADSVLGELIPGKKYQECTALGTIITPSPFAYGTWEFYWYKNITNNVIRIFFINSSRTFKGTDGYHFFVGTDESVNIYRYSGSSTKILGSAPAYIENNKWYKTRITREKSGRIYLYIRGGNFGNEGWTLVSVAGGTGTNPITDNTFKTSNYFISDIDTTDNDRFGEVEITEGVLQ